MNPSMGLGWGILPQTLLRRRVGQETLPPVWKDLLRHTRQR